MLSKRLRPASTAPGVGPTSRPQCRILAGRCLRAQSASQPASVRDGTSWLLLRSHRRCGRSTASSGQPRPSGQKSIEVFGIAVGAASASGRPGSLILSTSSWHPATCGARSQLRCPCSRCGPPHRKDRSQRGAGGGCPEGAAAIRGDPPKARTKTSVMWMDPAHQRLVVNPAMTTFGRLWRVEFPVIPALIVMEPHQG